jgi:glycosyltransferase involved in cell wall biosynthesis
MRFVLVSTHVDQTTGYAKVAYNLLRQLSSVSPKVKTFHFGFQRHPDRKNVRKLPDGIVGYDAASNEDPREEGFGFNKIAEYVEMVRPDVVMIYNDPLIICKFIEAMKYDKATSPFKLWLYVDQVYTGIAQPLVDTMNKSADRIYCFTQSWAETYAAYTPGSKVPSVIEHGIDAAEFTCMSRDQRLALRRNLKIPADAVVFLNANRNSQRKRLDTMIMAFAKLLTFAEEPVHLMVVTAMNPQHGAFYDIQRIFMSELKRVGLSQEAFASRLMIVDTAPPNTLSDAQMNEIYNLTDIGLNTSDGEGFGLCQLEHLYTGAPQVVTDVGSYRSFLNDDVATFVPPASMQYFAGSMPLGFSAPTFNPDDVAMKMNDVVKTLDTRKAAVRSFPFKSWTKVCDGWLEDVHTAA